MTMGEPAGVGPELTIKAKKILKKKYPFYVIGDFEYLSSIATKNDLETKKIYHYSETFQNLEKLCIIEHNMPDPIIPGKISSKNSSNVKEIIQKAVKLVFNNEALAVVTNPINKFALKKNNHFPYEGHTDFLASLENGDTSSVMMLMDHNGFRVVPTTVHIPIKQVSAKLTSKLLENTLITVEKSLRTDFFISAPKILVTGLNPHAGENSTMGYEENDIIKPVISKLRQAGLNLVGPVAADTAFTREKREVFDAFICMYHDQALIPIKTISFDESINITLGLSFVRTSPDHGTALDIAGKDTANPRSLVMAIKEAHKIASMRHLNAK